MLPEGVVEHVLSFLSYKDKYMGRYAFDINAFCYEVYEEGMVWITHDLSDKCEVYYEFQNTEIYKKWLEGRIHDKFYYFAGVIIIGLDPSLLSLVANCQDDYHACALILVLIYPGSSKPKTVLEYLLNTFEFSPEFLNDFATQTNSINLRNVVKRHKKSLLT